MHDPKSECLRRSALVGNQKSDLRDVYWAYVNARGLDFYDSDLSRASLRGAALEGAGFYDAVMVQAVLREANLTGTNFTGANLEGARLMGANLQGVNLTAANLTGANLQGANLVNTNLNEAVLSGVIYNTERIGGFKPTQWPADFDPTRDSVGALVLNECKD
jgi:uncharacterized protein YjbI with pentapeptide repeats